jgi:hypothetical protein
MGAVTDRWNLMLKELEKADLPQDAYMQPAYDALKDDFDALREMNHEQESLKGRLAVLTEKIEKLMFKSGHAHYSALHDLIRAKYGRGSPELKRYVPAAEAEVRKTKHGRADEN